MAQQSWLWNTDGTGDGKIGGYTQADWAIIAAILGACCGYEGVAPAYRNELAPAANGANTVRVATGGAVVDGKPYDSSTAVDVNVPSASGAGNTRIDRIVLRADWTAQTVRLTRLAGVDAASPSAPAITQTPGSVYDIMVCQVLVNTAGAVTVTDERVWAATNAHGLAPNAVTEPAIQNGAVTTNKHADDSVTNAKIRNSGALSVIGRAANSAGDPADISAASNDRLLARVSNALQWVQLTIGMIPDALITGAKMVANAITNDKFRQSGACSVVGRSANSTGNVADIAAAGNDTILRRVSNALGFGQLTAGMFPAGVVATAAIANDAVTPGKIPDRTRTLLVMADADEGKSRSVWGLPLPDGVDTYGYGAFAVPADFASGMSVRAVIVTGSITGTLPVASGTATYYYGAGGASRASHSDSGGASINCSDLTSNLIRLSDPIALDDAAVGDIVFCQYMRNGDAGSDTLTQTVYLAGWMVSYTADS